jgi:predicted tellurium resistance membrane protein TerC
MHLAACFDLLLALSVLTLLEIILGVDNLEMLDKLATAWPVYLRQERTAAAHALMLIVRITFISIFLIVMEQSSVACTLHHQKTDLAFYVLTLGGLALVVQSLGRLLDTGRSQNAVRGLAKSSSNSPFVFIKFVVLDLVLSLDTVVAAVVVAKHPVIVVGAIFFASAFVACCGRGLQKFLSQSSSLVKSANVTLLVIGTCALLQTINIETHISQWIGLFAIGIVLQASILWFISSTKPTRFKRAVVSTERPIIKKKRTSLPVRNWKEVNEIVVTEKEKTFDYDPYLDVVCGQCQQKRHRNFTFCIFCGKTDDAVPIELIYGTTAACGATVSKSAVDR